MSIILTTIEKDEQNALCSRFTEKAMAVSAVVTGITTFDDALKYCIDLCGRGDCLASPSDGARHAGPETIVAAPGLDPAQFAALSALCDANGTTCINIGMRNHLRGVDIGFTVADAGIAETGTLVISCPSEEQRLATMLCDRHVCVLSRSNIVGDAFAAERQMSAHMRKSPDYTAFITGASRTADIERVLALGVHGPLELHILLLED